MTPLRHTEAVHSSRHEGSLCVFNCNYYRSVRLGTRQTFEIKVGAASHKLSLFKQVVKDRINSIPRKYFNFLFLGNSCIKFCPVGLLTSVEPGQPDTT